jgi:hypothetical protein
MGIELTQTNIYQRESVELLKITIKKDKLNLVSNNVFIAVIDSDERPVPGDWKPAIITDDNKYGYLLDNLPINTYTVWARVMNAPEDVIWHVGTVRIV